MEKSTVAVTKGEDRAVKPRKMEHAEELPSQMYAVEPTCSQAPVMKGQEPELFEQRYTPAEKYCTLK